VPSLGTRRVPKRYALHPPSRDVALFAVALIFVGACGGGVSERRPPPPIGETERGLATWYGGSLNGSATASGERFDQTKMTAAHKTLPLGTVVRVTNLKNDRQVTVRINDRGPYARGRIIDLSRAAARIIGMIDDGVVPVLVEILSLPERRAR
jgi:rare lipoprotein A